MTRKTAASWKPGQSGNPAGRPKGSKNKATLLALAAMEGEIEAIVRSIIKAAKKGDMAAARLVVDKLIPAAKDRPIEIKLPSLSDIAGCQTAQGQLIRAVAGGDLMPGEGEHLSAMIEHQRKALEGADILARLDAIEERLNLKEGI